MNVWKRAKKAPPVKILVRRVRLFGDRWRWLVTVPSRVQGEYIFATFPTHAEAIQYAHKNAVDRIVR
jgi:hypothetical protein